MLVGRSVFGWKFLIAMGTDQGFTFPVDESSFDSPTVFDTVDMARVGSVFDTRRAQGLAIGSKEQDRIASRPCNRALCHFLVLLNEDNGIV